MSGTKNKTDMLAKLQDKFMEISKKVEDLW